MTEKCACGAEAHPLYSGRCEDCWVSGHQGNMGRCPAGHSIVHQLSGEVSRQFSQRSDRRWHRPSTKPDS